MAHILYTEHAKRVPITDKSNRRAHLRSTLRRAWYLIHFREWLAGGIVTFSFFKKDGTIREAKGTLHPLLIPADKMPKGSEDYTPNYSTIPFFDLEKQEWRSFNICNFIGFVSVYQLVYFSSKTAQKIDKLTLKERA